MRTETNPITPPDSASTRQRSWCTLPLSSSKGQDRLNSSQPFGDAEPLAAAATLQLRIVEPHAVEVRSIGGVPRFVGSPPQQVVELAGPWRVEESWWARATGEGTPLARDEYDVCLDDGALLRLAREDEGWSVRGVYD